MASRLLRVAVDGAALADGRAFAGIGRYATELLDALLELDSRVELHVARPARPPRSARWSYRWARNQAALAGLVRRVRPDVVFCPASEAAVGLPPRRQIVTVHDALPWAAGGSRALDARAYLRLQRALISRAAEVIVPGETVVPDVVARLGVPTERITPIAHGVPRAYTAHPAADDAAARARARLGERPYLVWVGSLHGVDPRKGLDVLLAACAALPASERPVLALIGRPGGASAWARAEGGRLGVSIVLPGYLEDRHLAALLRGAVAAVVPSRYEGFGLPALEAMACGAPVVVTDAGHAPAVVGEAALVVPAGDPGALAQAMGELVRNAELRGRLSAAGPARAAAYSWTRAAERTLAVFERAALE